MSFDEAARLHEVDPGHFRIEIPAGWEQGRSTFGGLTLGIMLRAMQRSAADPTRPPRSITAELCGQLTPGAAEITVETLRAGSSLSTLDSRISQDGEIVARASLVLAAGRSGEPLGIASTLESAPTHWSEIEVATLPIPPAPVFTQHIAFRPISGFPFSGQRSDEVTGWVSFAAPPPVYDHGSLLGLLDAYWPVSLAKAAGPRPGATVSFMAEFFSDPSALDPTFPLYYRARAIAEHQGYSLEVRELWHEGELIALNQQVFVTLR